MSLSGNKYIRCTDAQRLCKARHRRHGGTALTPLYASDVVPVDAALETEFLLGEAGGGAQVADRAA